MFQYYIPESRSKRLGKAVDLARQLTGFEDLDDGYRVSPTPLEIAEPTFSKLLELSEKWKGSAFLINGEEVDKSTFLERAAEAAASREEEPIADEPEPEPIKEEAPSEEVQPEPVAETPRKETGDETSQAEPAQDKAPEQPPESVESSPKVVPATSRPPQITPEPKKGCCCFGPLGLVAIVLIIISQFW